jgi:predicted HTH transcriptional regulator
LQKGIHEDRSYLIMFLRNLLLGESNLLENKTLHVVPLFPASDESRETRLLSLLKDNPTMKTDELAKALGVSLRTTKSIISALKKEGKLSRVDGKKYGHWKVKDI